MKLKLIVLVLALPCLLNFTAFAGGVEDPVVMTVDGVKVHKSEFENIFKKNNKETEVTKESLDEYLELFINFKLKVRAAEELGMDTVSKFVNELEGYRRQLRRPYMVDSEKNDQLVEEAYERSKSEVRASHFLIKLDSEPTPDDTAAAWDKAIKARERVLAGEDFAKVALEVSEDPSVKQNNGDLGYFSAFQMVYPFENAAFNTEVGGLSNPVRTRFGYHILKIYDMRPARGQIKVAHIMIANEKDEKGQEIGNGQQRIDEIYQQLEGGEGFADLAMKYSDDKNSAKKGGELPVFGAGRMVQDFEEQAFKLQKDGDYSLPFQTSYGWHIVKRLEHFPVPDFEAQKDKLKQKVQRDARSQVSEYSFIQKLKGEYNFAEYAKSWKEINKQVDTTLFYGTWSPPKAKKLKKVLYSFNGKDYTQMDFAQMLMDQQRDEPKKGLNLETYVQNRYTSGINKMITEYEDSQLENKYPQFRLLMKEYRDGILLFELTNERVWNKAVKDTTGLKSFYEQNKANYMWGERLDAIVYTCKDGAIAKRVLYLKKRGKGNGEIAGEVNKESALNINITSGKYEKGESVVDQFEWKVGTSEVKEINGQHVFIEVKEVLPAQPKALKEAKGMITADYQDDLEKNWIKELREKYEVKVDYDVLYSIK